MISNARKPLNMNNPLRLSFLSSGKGNLTATIIYAIKKGVIKNVIPVSIMSDRNSNSLKLASLFGGSVHVVDFTKCKSRDDFSDKLLDILNKEEVDFSFMTFDRILSGKIVNKYKNRIINIHPSLLPAFPGYRTIEKARNYGCTFVGATCHFIDNEIDHGPIINQAILPINTIGNLSSIEEKLYKLRQQLALEAIYAFSNNLINVNKRKVIIKNANYNMSPVNPSLGVPEINDFLRTYGA